MTVDVHSSDCETGVAANLDWLGVEHHADAEHHAMRKNEMPGWVVSWEKAVAVVLHAMDDAWDALQ